MHENSTNQWQNDYAHELELAYQARRQGNEGRARVCARRMAGILLTEFFRRKGIELPSMNALGYIRYSVTSPWISEDLRETLRHFTLKVDEKFTLPPHIDLIAEAEWLKTRLLD